MQQNIVTSHNVAVDFYTLGGLLAAGISYSINGFCWLTIGNAILSWAYIASKIWPHLNF